MSDERGEMTPQELDELASAYLDGEATAEEAALVESDPRLQALVEELRAVRDLVAAPVELPADEVRDQMIARAVAHRAPVVSLEKARRRLRSVPPQARVILAAAAVVAVIAMVGVTLFERGSDEFADDDMASAPASEAPADESVEAPVAESAAEDADDALEFSSPDSGAVEDEALPEPVDLMQLEEPAEEAMVAAEPAAPVSDSPEMADEAFADTEPLEAPSDDSADAETALESVPEELVPTSGEALLVFETEADLVAHIVLVAEELTAAERTDRDDEATAIDLMGCPLLPNEELELLIRFDAIVEQIESQVSVYIGDSELQFTQTTPSPECELFNSHTFLDWPR